MQDVRDRAIRLILASRSPRRARMLRDAGYRFEQIDPPFTDPPQPPAPAPGSSNPAPNSSNPATGQSSTAGGGAARALAADLAKQKALSLCQAMFHDGDATQGPSDELTQPCVILAADTICVSSSGAMIGQPRNRADAAAMIRSFTNASHEVVTGICLIRLARERATSAAQSDAATHAAKLSQAINCFADAAVVHFAAISEARLQMYLDSDQWRDKAGGYNLFDRQADGWPIEVTGDPTTVVGLPMRKLIPALRAFGIDIDSSASETSRDHDD